ncbi:MAG: class I SAM-dependent methyltransferase [Chlamydiota bacterium]
MKSQIEIFDHDARVLGGYGYTLDTRLSSRLAVQRSLEAMLAACPFAGRSVLDAAAGDGFYTIRFYDRAKTRTLVAADAAPHAIGVAREHAAGRPIHFMVADANAMPWSNDSFEVALVQSVLHHADDPLGILRESFRVAPTVVIHEPNGNNPFLKIIERLSPYHHAHHERSYSSLRFGRWIREAGGTVVMKSYAGFVPMFCPVWLTHGMKAIEPLVERLPIARGWACAVVVYVCKRR